MQTSLMIPASNNNYTNLMRDIRREQLVYDVELAKELVSYGEMQVASEILAEHRLTVKQLDKIRIEKGRVILKI